MEKVKLSPEQYWEWRTTIAEMQTAEKELKLKGAQYEGQQKDLEIVRLKSALFRHTMMSADAAFKQHQEEYKRFKAELEDSLGVSLDNKVIDEVTFEIKELPDNGTS